MTLDVICSPCCSPQGRYSRFVANRPCILVGVIFALSTMTLIISLVKYGLPNMELNSKEFLTIGTDYSSKMLQYNSLTQHGQDLPQIIRVIDPKVSTTRHRRFAAANQSARCTTRLRITNAFDYSPDNKLSVVYKMSGAMSSYKSGSNSTRSLGILSFIALRSICEAEKMILEHLVYRESCHMDEVTGKCYESFSVPNLMSLYFNLSCCKSLTHDHVNRMSIVLNTCQSIFRNHTPEVCCFNKFCDCPEYPSVCRSPYIWFMFQFLLPNTFTDTSSTEFVQSIFELPSHIKGMYKAVLKQSYYPVQIGAINLSPEAQLQLYGDIVVKNVPWLCLALLGIMIMIWLHTYSLTLVFTTIVIIFFSLALAYAVNAMIMGSNDFSMLNMMAVVVLVGIGSDDVFVMYSSWKHAKKDHRDCHLEKLVSDTIKHAGLSVTVTSATTVAAFMANLISPVVAINAFAVYASLGIIFNLCFMLTVIPAMIVISENHFKCITFHKLNLMYTVTSSMLKKVYSRFLSYIAVNLRYLIHLLTVSVFIFCFLSTAYYPGLKYPDQHRRSLFSSDNPLETFLLKYSNSFRYQKYNKPVRTLQIIMVWGVSPKDGRSRLVPTQTVPINYNNKFNLTSNVTRLWLQSFCSSQILNAPHLSKVFPNMNCIFNNVDPHLLQSFNLISHSYYCGNSPCCNVTFPAIANASLFYQCLNTYVLTAKSQYYKLYQNFKPFYFNKGKLGAFQATYFTNIPVDSNYTYLAKVTNEIETWFSAVLKGAPLGVSNAFLYIEHLQEWELRRTLRNSVVQSAGAALLASAVTILLTTLNPLLALQALIVLLVTLSSTLTTLLWLDWRINIVECVILTVSFGLAVDFTLHYGVAFKLHLEKDRFQRAKLVMKNVSPPLTFAALTTALAGAVVLPSEVLVIRMTGVFLLTVSCSAWFGAMLVFPSIIVTLGNKNANLAQFSLPEFETHNCCLCVLCCTPVSQERVDLTQYASEFPEPTDLGELSCTESSSDRLLLNSNHVTQEDSPVWKRRLE